MITIQENVPLAPLTSLEIGGPARFFVQVETVAELREALLFSQRERLSVGILGGGTNLLVSDRGFDGLVIRMQLPQLSVSGERVRAEAGVDLTALVHQTAEWGLSGLEPLAGIPGLVGGAVRGNAGAYGSCIGDVTSTVQALQAETLELLVLGREECDFHYRNSRFKRNPALVVVAVELALRPEDPEQARGKVAAIIAKRSARNLQCDRSAGSFFMNPVVADPELVRRFESDQQVVCREGRIPAGWLIDRAGLRNCRVGGAMVSALHANYLINTGSASAEELLRLARLVKREVRESMGVELQEEVSSLGFATFPPEPESTGAET
jgi:UDP-N-acetylmuramate dehydrogenase